jgi:hypothetical protein
MKTVERLQALNAAVVGYLIPALRLHTLTVDVDGAVVSTGLQVERACRGYNPHHRKVHGASGRNDACAAGKEPLGQRA